MGVVVGVGVVVKVAVGVGAPDGVSVGDAVAATVGEAVSATVGEAVPAGVGETVGATVDPQAARLKAAIAELKMVVSFMSAFTQSTGMGAEGYIHANASRASLG